MLSTLAAATATDQGAQSAGLTQSLGLRDGHCIVFLSFALQLLAQMLSHLRRHCLKEEAITFLQEIEKTGLLQPLDLLTYVELLPRNSSVGYLQAFHEAKDEMLLRCLSCAAGYLDTGIADSYLKFQVARYKYACEIQEHSTHQGPSFGAFLTLLKTVVLPNGRAFLGQLGEAGLTALLNLLLIFGLPDETGGGGSGSSSATAATTRFLAALLDSLVACCTTGSQQSGSAGSGSALFTLSESAFYLFQRDLVDRLSRRLLIQPAPTGGICEQVLNTLLIRGKVLKLPSANSNQAVKDACFASLRLVCGLLLRDARCATLFRDNEGFESFLLPWLNALEAEQYPEQAEEVLQTLNGLLRASEKYVQIFHELKLLSLLAPLFQVLPKGQSSLVCLIGNVSRHSDRCYSDIEKFKLVKHILNHWQTADETYERTAAFAVGNMAFHSNKLYAQLAPTIGYLREIVVRGVDEERTVHNAIAALCNFGRNGSELVAELRRNEVVDAIRDRFGRTKEARILLVCLFAFSQFLSFRELLQRIQELAPWLESVSEQKRRLLEGAELKRFLAYRNRFLERLQGTMAAS